MKDGMHYVDDLLRITMNRSEVKRELHEALKLSIVREKEKSVLTMSAPPRSVNTDHTTSVCVESEGADILKVGSLTAEGGGSMSCEEEEQSSKSSIGRSLDSSTTAMNRLPAAGEIGRFVLSH